MRCFLALLPPPGFGEALGSYLDALAPRLAGWRRVRPEGLHLTLAFLGDTGPDGVAAVTEALRVLEAAAPPAPVFVFRRVTGFPSRGRPRALVLEPEGGLPETLAAREFLRAALAGFPRLAEAFGASFRAHLTLARPGSGAARPPVGMALPPDQSGPAVFGRVALMESTLGPGGSRYCILAQATLRGPA